ncbi:hypothetical protein LCGC14_1036760 [marine sediment metagenome]|uniref:Uncharacterized protein n=1 Tax=marine sediment metagenome TaxID=412755 RepID=A0A0F9QZ29_9ZZZZ
MTETMTEVEVIVPCPSCARPMGSIGNSWQCLACNPIPVDIPTCATQKCKKPLTKLGDPWNCWICLKCNKHPEEVNKMQKEEDQRKRKYLDKKLTTEDVSEMIKAEMAGVKDMIREALAEQRPAYPPTQAEIQTMTAPENVNAKPVEKPETWMQKAKRLGVQTHIPDGRGMRKKAEIMADIESLGKEETIEEANTFREKAQSPPGEGDEYARGMTEEDMMT